MAITQFGGSDESARRIILKFVWKASREKKSWVIGNHFPSLEGNALPSSLTLPSIESGQTHHSVMVAKRGEVACLLWMNHLPEAAKQAKEISKWQKKWKWLFRDSWTTFFRWKISSNKANEKSLSTVFAFASFTHSLTLSYVMQCLFVACLLSFFSSTTTNDDERRRRRRL